MSGREYTKKEEQFIIDNYGKLSYEEIAKELKRSWKGIKKKAFKLLKDKLVAPGTSKFTRDAVKKYFKEKSAE